MSTATLIQKLMDIEHAIGVKDSTTIRNMLIDAQDSVLGLQKELVDYLRAKPAFLPAR